MYAGDGAICRHESDADYEEACSTDRSAVAVREQEVGEHHAGRLNHSVYVLLVVDVSASSRHLTQMTTIA